MLTALLCVWWFVPAEAQAVEDIDVLKAKTSMLSYLTEETCTMDPQLRSTLGLAVGDQFLLTVQSNSKAYGLVTVHSDYEDGSDNNDVRVRLSGRQRFNESDSFDGWAEAWTPVHGQTDSWLSSNNELGEFLEETSASQTDLVILAPHGGAIEGYTDELAQEFYDEMTVTYSKDASAWYCIGYQGELGAFDAWHITSTDLSENSFPYLDDIAGRTYDYAVSFHGYSGGDVLVGGGCSTAHKEDVKDALDLISWSYTVTVVGVGDDYSGTDPDNIVNRYSSCGVQLELPYSARRDYWQDIAGALADFYETLI